MFTALVVHFAAAALAPALVRRLGRGAFYLLALVPAATAVYVAVLGPQVIAGSPVVEAHPWIPQLGMTLTLRLDALSWVFLLIVSGIGALIFAYCARYFSDSEPGLGRFAGVLLAFAGAMAGLVIADDMMLLFIFWELTTIFSYLLIGHYLTKQASRRAAMNALISTTIGGLAMMVGLLIIAHDADSMLLSDVLQRPESVGVVALVLVLVGCATKSALVPGHFWLPGAMAAPTPVSAYLHAAAMVKAGIYLLLRMAPSLELYDSLRIAAAVLGVATMVLGGWRALRQFDIKLLLAYGTVSQLGFMAAIAALATDQAVFAAVALVIGHALFKAPLFMVVGAIDKSYGTRDLRRLHGVWKDAPALGIIAILAAASMAAIPPLYGFMAKEAVFTAMHEMGGWGLPVLVGVTAGSVLTVAYSWRFIAGVFPGEGGILERPVPVLFWAPAALLVAVSAALIPLVGALNTVLHAIVTGPFDLHVVPVLGLPLLASGIAIVGGVLLALWADGFEALQKRVSPLERPWGKYVDAERGFRSFMRGIDLVSVKTTAQYQRGSLPLTVGTILGVMIMLAGVLILTRGFWPQNVVAFHHWSEAAIAVLAIGAGIGAARSRRRLRAALLLTGSGYAVALLFMVAGAPDVAATQLLVETVVTVVFVLVLRRLPTHFSIRPLKRDQWSRWIFAIGTAIVVCLLAVYAASARSADPTGPDLIDAGYEIGGGHNTVNVTLVDARVWDTMGEIAVLLVVASGVASLLFVTKSENHVIRVRDVNQTVPVWRRSQDADLPDNITHFDATPEEADGNRWHTWLHASKTLAPERRLVMIEVITRVVFPLLMVLSVYLLMAGHNHPGGGFAGGLVAGLAVTLRYLAGGRFELAEAMPVQAGHVLGAGMAIAVLSGAAPLLWGGGIFDSVVLHPVVPVIGEVELASALVFDIGVYLVVFGMVLDFLRTLGEQIDRQQEAELSAH